MWLNLWRTLRIGTTPRNEQKKKRETMKNILSTKKPPYTNNKVRDYLVILNFSKKLFRKSKSVEKEFVDFVNENFWDLLKP